MDIQLEKAKQLASEKKFQDAINLIDDFLKINPVSVDGIRLKGNILEFQAYAVLQTSSYDDESFNKLLESAKICYEKLLEFFPGCTVAYIDLGDYWDTKGNALKALL